MNTGICPTCKRDDEDPRSLVCSNAWHIRDKIESVTYENGFAKYKIHDDA